MKEIDVTSSKKEEYIDITSVVSRAVSESGVKEGLCFLFVPHTTCGLVINEHADPDVMLDAKSALGRIVPDAANYRHLEGNSPAHIKSVLTGVDLTLIIEDGRIKLGTWQGIFFCEFDGPRRRKLWVKIIPG